MSANKGVWGMVMRGMAALALVLVLELLLGTPAEAQNKAILDGVWNGQYSCGGTTATLTVVVSSMGDRFIFAYPNGVTGEYKISAGYDPKRKRFDANPRGWVSQAPAGISMVGMTGIVSDDLRSMTGTVQRCGAFTLQLDPGATAPAPLVASAPAPNNDNRTDRAARRINAPQTPSLTGIWSGQGIHCTSGPMDLRVEFEKHDVAGFDALVIVRPASESTPFELKARTAPGRLRDEVVITTELAPSGPLSRQPSIFLLQPDAVYRGSVRGRATSPNCAFMRLERANPERTAPGKPADVPTQYAALQGAWDGAMFLPRAGGVVEVALVISPSTAGVERRLFDVQAIVDKRVAAGGLLQAADNFVMRTDRSSKEKVDGTIDSRIKMVDGQEFLAMVMFANGKGGKAFLFRRPPGSQKSLQALCNGEVNDWQRGRMKAREVARELKVTYFPALASYNTERASLAEAVATADSLRAVAGNIAVERLLRDCALTAPGLGTIEDLHLLDEFVDLPAIRNARPRLADGIEPGQILASIKLKAVSLDRITAETQAAETDLPQIVRRGEGINGTTAILDFSKSIVRNIQNARPAVVAHTLAPLSARLEQADRHADGVQTAARRDYATRRMRGITAAGPDMLAGRAPLLNAIATGTMSTFARGDTSFIAGLLGGSIEKCGEPPMTTRLILMGLLKEGAQLGMGVDYSGDLTSMLGSMAKGNRDYADGVRSIVRLGCSSAYMTALFDILAHNIGARGQGKGGRAGLLVRTCSLDRNAEQCECIRSVLETTTPGISGARFDRAMISRTISMSPTQGVELGVRCGVNYY